MPCGRAASGAASPRSNPTVGLPPPPPPRHILAKPPRPGGAGGGVWKLKGRKQGRRRVEIGGYDRDNMEVLDWASGGLSPGHGTWKLEGGLAMEFDVVSKSAHAIQPLPVARCRWLGPYAIFPAAILSQAAPIATGPACLAASPWRPAPHHHAPGTLSCLLPLVVADLFLPWHTAYRQMAAMASGGPIPRVKKWRWCLRPYEQRCSVRSANLAAAPRLCIFRLPSAGASIPCLCLDVSCCIKLVL
uniref:Uncharacterized protein n=1 Tax=Arundo donax TaxID=35708 RepID=A0A0A9GK92_ARUDO